MYRRKRSANFSRRDNKIFVRLVDRYKHILENKACDGSTNERKTMTWIHLTNIFNRHSTTGIVRDVDQLKQKLVNLRKSERRESQQLSPTNADLDETIDEFALDNEESIDDSMDPLDFELTECTDSHYEAGKAIENVQKSSPPMSNDNVLNLLEDFVAKLRKKNRPGQGSNSMDKNYAVSANIKKKNVYFYDAIKMKIPLPEYQFIESGIKRHKNSGSFGCGGLWWRPLGEKFR